MSTPGFVADWPHLFLTSDGDTVEVFQLRPDLVEQFIAWTGGTPALINGGPAVLLPEWGVCGLGDFAVRTGPGLVAEPAAGFYDRFTPLLEDPA